MEPPKQISPTKCEFNGRMYYLCGQYYQRQGIRNGVTITKFSLHRDVWQAYNGPIPKDHHIHHIDENKLNNHPSNLECIHKGEHIRQHRLRDQNIKKAQAVWTKRARSDTGRRFMRHISAKSWENTRALAYICDHCSIMFYSQARASPKYCGSNCRQKAYRRRRKGLTK